jgi:uncharacterized protein (DUF1697 family)
MRMSDVCHIFTALGFNNVYPILVTGNIIFASNKTMGTLEEIIRENLSHYHSFAIDVFVRNDKEIRNIFNGNPFEIRKEMYTQTFICKDGFELILSEKLNEISFLEGEKVAFKK